MEGHALQGRGLPDSLEQGDHALQPLQVALDLEQLHMVGDLPLRAAAQRGADVLHLAQEDHDLVIGLLQLIGAGGAALHVAQFRLQRRALVRGVEPQMADPLLAEGAAAVEVLQHVLETDLYLFIEADGDHASSSFTLITGASTASDMARRKASLSNFQP